MLDGYAGPPSVEADEVDRGSGEGVFQADFAEAGVSGLAGTGDRGGLVDGAFDPGPCPVDLFPRVGLLFGVGVSKRFVQVVPLEKSSLLVKRHVCTRW